MYWYALEIFKGNAEWSENVLGFWNQLVLFFNLKALDLMAYSRQIYGIDALSDRESGSTWDEMKAQ